jgi:hypothetical protein
MFYCRHTIVRIDYELISSHTFYTGAGHRLLIATCGRHWLMQEPFPVNLIHSLHSVVTGTASFAAGTTLISAFKQARSVLARRPLANISLKSVKRQLTLTAKWGWANVLKQPLGQPRYWETLNLLYSEIQVIYSFILEGSVAGSNLDHELLHYVNFLKRKCCTEAVWNCVCTRGAHCVFQCDVYPAIWVGRHVRQWLNGTYPRKLFERIRLTTWPPHFSSPVALRTDSASWPHLTEFAITFIGHTTLRRTPLDVWSTRHNTHMRQKSIFPAGGLLSYRIKSDWCVATSEGTC